ncbi:hypothetical protein [Pseudomonas sp. 24 E 13]|nr:hypothetical protein [Pseudomonas sp. 24 E 13]
MSVANSALLSELTVATDGSSQLLLPSTVCLVCVQSLADKYPALTNRPSSDNVYLRTS